MSSRLPCHRPPSSLAGIGDLFARRARLRIWSECHCHPAGVAFFSRPPGFLKHPLNSFVTNVLEAVNLPESYPNSWLMLCCMCLPWLVLCYMLCCVYLPWLCYVLCYAVYTYRALCYVLCCVYLPWLVLYVMLCVAALASVMMCYAPLYVPACAP